MPAQNTTGINARVTKRVKPCITRSKLRPIPSRCSTVYKSSALLKERCIAGNMKRALATEYTQNPETMRNGFAALRYTVPVRV